VRNEKRRARSDDSARNTRKKRGQGDKEREREREREGGGDVRQREIRFKVRRLLLCWSQLVETVADIVGSIHGILDRYRMSFQPGVLKAALTKRRPLRCRGISASRGPSQSKITNKQESEEEREDFPSRKAREKNDS